MNADNGLGWLSYLVWPVVFAAAGYLAFIVYKYGRDLRDSPRELWFVSISQVTEFVAYSVMLSTLTLFLSSDVGMSDVAAGNYIGGWNVSYTILMFGVGALVDAVGVKRVLVIGTVLAIVSRFFLFTTTNIWSLTFFGFATQAVSIAFLSPVITVAIKRYTKADTSAMGFAMFYTLMNVGFALGGLLFDHIRVTLGEYGTTVLPLVGTISTYRFILFASFLLSFPGMFFIAIMRDGLNLKDDGSLEIIPAKKSTGAFLPALGNTVKGAFVDAYRIFVDVMKQPAFWKFMLLLTVLLGVNYVFFHFHYTFPKYGIRVLGEGAKIGNVYGVLNPAIIVFFVPFIAWLTRTWSPYLMITVGSFISAGSIFLVTLPESTFVPLVDTVFGRLIWQAWLGLDPATDPTKLALYIALAIFVALFTVGEAIWSPRLMEYTARIAPEGQEASYMTLSLLPKFLSQPLVAFMSGALLSSYVPVQDKIGPDGQAILNEAGQAVQVVGDISNHHMVWVWVGIVAVTSPIGMLILRKFVSPKEPAQG
jgi:MFS family permease